MNASESLRTFVGIVSSDPLLARLFFASLEFAVLALIVGAALRVSRFKSPRLAAVLWLLVLAKPLASLAIGTPIPIVEFEAPSANLTTAEPLPVMQAPPAFPDADAALPDSFPANRQFGRPALGQFDNTGEAEAGASGLPTAAPSVLSASTPASMTPIPLRHAWMGVNPGRLISALWIAGCALFFLLAVIDRLRMRGLVTHARKPGAELSSHYASIGAEFGCRRLPGILETDDLESPALIGTLAPVILIPTWLASDLNPAQLDWALRHELMHWKLFDPIAGLVRQLARILFYFHPAAWWAGQKWEEATELACDRAIVKSAKDSQDYAEQLYGMLVQIRNRRRISVGSGLFATRTQIGRRIAALLSGTNAAPARLSALAIASVLLLSIVTLSIGGTFADKLDKTSETVTASEGLSTDQTTSLDPQPDENQASTPSPSTGSAGLKPGPGASERSAAREKAQAAQAGAPPDDDTFSCAGTVVDPDGKPFAGAELRLKYPRANDSDWKPSPSFATMSAANGRFRFSIPKSEFDISSRDEPWNFARIYAMAEGFGFDESQFKPGQPDDIRLQLVKDLPINGRILSLEGTPIAGTVIRMVGGVNWTPGESLDSYISALGEGRANFRFERQASSPFFADETIRTDPDGRFRLRGMGAERLVALYVEGSTIEQGWIHVLTCETKVAALSQELKTGRSRSPRTYVASFEHLAAPGRPIMGTVRDRATGKPLAGVAVTGVAVDGFGASFTTQTNEAGRFELFGYPKSRDYILQVRPADGQPYFPASPKIADTPGLEPIETDVALATATLCRGQLIDNSTGPRVTGKLQYYPMYPNPAASKLPDRGIEGKPWSTVAIKRDGQFVVPVLPGPGVLAFLADTGKGSDYAPAFISPKEIEEFFGRKLSSNNSEEILAGVMRSGQAVHGIRQAIFQGLALINPEEGAESITRDVTLEPGRKLRGTLHGPDDQPLADVTVYGLTPRLSASTTLKTAEFEAIGLSARRPRVIQFTHIEKKLGFALTIRGDDLEPLIVQLKPLGAAVGRLLDKEGEPVRESKLQFSNEQLLGPPGGYSSRTDQEGRFRLDNLVPGLKYNLNAQRENGVAFRIAAVSVESGETKDLGDVRPGPNENPKPPAAAAPSKTEAPPRAASEKILRALGTSTTVAFQGVPLAEALRSLGKYHDIDVRIDNDALKAANISIEGKVTWLRFAKISLHAILNLLLELESLGYVVDGDELVVTTREKADARIEEIEYDLGDAVRAGVSLADLGDAIVQTVDRGMWDKHGGAGRLRSEGTKLVLRQRADVQRHVQNLLVDVQRALVAVPGVFEDGRLELKTYPIADLRKGVSDSDLGNWLRESLLIETSPENIGRADLKMEGDQMELKQPPWVHVAAAKYLATIRAREGGTDATTNAG